MVFTNTGDSDLAITNMEGYYCTTGGRGLLWVWLLPFLTGDGLGEWVKCDDGWIGEKSFHWYHFCDAPNFNIKSAQNSTLAIQLCIKIEGNAHIKIYLLIHTVWRETLAVRNFGELSAKLPLVKLNLANCCMECASCN